MKGADYASTEEARSSPHFSKEYSKIDASHGSNEAYCINDFSEFHTWRKILLEMWRSCALPHHAPHYWNMTVFKSLFYCCHSLCYSKSLPFLSFVMLLLWRRAGTTSRYRLLIGEVNAVVMYLNATKNCHWKLVNGNVLRRYLPM